MHKVLIANRGEIALRIMRSCKRLDIATVAVYSAADRHALHVKEADEACYIGPPAVEQSYLNIDNLLEAARASGADAVHPGYGFLSENPAFAKAVENAGLCWIGPPPQAMAQMASKIAARAIATEHGIPIIPAFTLPEGAEFDCKAITTSVGLPLLIKSSAGGGGIGMREVHAAEELPAALAQAREQAQRQFGSGDLLVERLIRHGRHVEVQLVGDQHGKLLHLFERDCSAQRRRQKLLEEAPAPGLSAKLRVSLQQAAVQLAAAVNYHGVGTVEFLLEGEEFYLLEMNTRLQVEHGVTEAVCALDLVQLQLEIANGQPLLLDQADISCRGHAIEARIYAEDPTADFRPATGSVAAFSCAAQAGLRIDSGVATGSDIGHHYDGLLCKLIVHADNRDAASQRLQRALNGLQLAGIISNQQFLRAVLASPHWDQGIKTTTLESELPGLLAAAELQPVPLGLALAAATIWTFRRRPPAADQVAWPGAFALQRQTTWLVGGAQREVSWRWTGATEFTFAELDLVATMLPEQGDQNSLALEIGGQRRMFRLHDDGGTLWLWQQELGNVQLQSIHTATDTMANGQRGHCSSHGPGQVLRVLVAPGEQVLQQQALVVIESMKMESTLCASTAGRVAEVAVSEGELIASGQLLVKLEQSERSEA